MAKIVNGYDAMVVWNRAHIERRIHSHFAMSCERNMAMRAWDIRCSCGRRGMVCDGVGDPGLYVCEDDIHGNAFGERDSAMGPSGVAIAKSETTKTTATDVVAGTRSVFYVSEGWSEMPGQADYRLAASIRAVNEKMREGTEKIREAGDKWRDYENDKRLRAAMAGMANVMRAVYSPMWRQWNLDQYTTQQREGGVWLGRGDGRGGTGRDEWSRRVREGVVKLRPPGPSIACQGDWED